MSATCCDVCRSDDGRICRISQELLVPRLPHPGCPKGLCKCRWDLTARDRAILRSTNGVLRGRTSPASRRDPNRRSDGTRQPAERTTQGPGSAQERRPRLAPAGRAAPARRQAPPVTPRRGQQRAAAGSCGRPPPRRAPQRWAAACPAPHRWARDLRRSHGDAPTIRPSTRPRHSCPGYAACAIGGSIRSPATRDPVTRPGRATGRSRWRAWLRPTPLIARNGSFRARADPHRLRFDRRIASVAGPVAVENRRTISP